MTNSAALRENAHGWILPLAERRVTRFVIDFALTFDFWLADDKHSHIRIGVPFTLTKGERATHLDPEQAAELGPILALHQEIVRRAVAARDGSLKLEFNSGTLISVPPSSEYEAWEASLDDGTQLVSQPGGTIAIWGGQGSGIGASG
ncbi:MAG: DUF6188 family protein [Gemmatimonadaceae bacterium]